MRGQYGIFYGPFLEGLNIKALVMRTKDGFMNDFSNQNEQNFHLRGNDGIFYEPFSERLNHHVDRKALFMRTQV